LRMAGELADGVWIRVGRHPDNLRAAWEQVCEGARSVGRDPADIELGLIFHTAVADDPQIAHTMALAIAAGYYEYSPFLFDAPGISWAGPDVHELRVQAYPDFHHHRDPVHAGKLVSFLPPEAADAFALYGDWDAIASQLQAVLQLGLPVSVILPHPITPVGSTVNYLRDCAEQLIRNFRAE
ncbi:MAG: LLM class flavin-dependent oxidoreductase, partial [Pseudomonadales bacterium]|nr:LLM class flavin-dependent oxidoreductase [Pseudomonadales bacterium]